MTTKDIAIEKASQTIDKELKIYLEVRVNDKDEVGIRCNYNGASSVLLLQTIAYMLDVAYEGKEEPMVAIAEQMPDVVKEYCRLKGLQEDVDKAEQNLRDTIESIDTKTLEGMLKAELEKEADKRDIDYFMKLSSELMKRGINDGRTTPEAKA